MKHMSLGLQEALRLTLEAITPLPDEDVSLIDSVDRIAASDIYANVDSPLVDSSRKDGYAVLSCDVLGATVENPVRLQLLGSLAAGDGRDIQIKPGTAVRVSTGARIPAGADAVVAEEYVKKGTHDILIENHAKLQNVLKRGSDVAVGKCILRTGRLITPAVAGLLAAAGHSRVPVFRSPIVGILGTGDELVEPGKPLTDGKLYASNITTLAGWCRRYGMKSRMGIVKDNQKTLMRVLKNLAAKTDVVITSGGAWTGERDLMAHVLDMLGWEKIFHRVRMGPGKAIGFGLLNNKPVFILAGGPSSNLIGFLQIALPGILALSGHKEPQLQRISAKLSFEITGGKSDWTDFFFGTLEWDNGLPAFYPMTRRSSLNSIAEANALASVPEGQHSLQAGSVISVQLLR
jgi:molybdopterin molybdotransferase